jgi:hypothetical protein
VRLALYEKALASLLAARTDAREAERGVEKVRYRIALVDALKANEAKLREYAAP